MNISNLPDVLDRRNESSPYSLSKRGREKKEELDNNRIRKKRLKAFYIKLYKKTRIRVQSVYSRSVIKCRYKWHSKLVFVLFLFFLSSSFANLSEFDVVVSPFSTEREIEGYNTVHIRGWETHILREWNAHTKDVYVKDHWPLTTNPYTVVSKVQRLVSSCMK